MIEKTIFVSGETVPHHLVDGHDSLKSSEQYMLSKLLSDPYSEACHGSTSFLGIDEHSNAVIVKASSEGQMRSFLHSGGRSSADPLIEKRVVMSGVVKHAGQMSHGLDVWSLTGGSTILSLDHLVLSEFEVGQCCIVLV